MKVYGWDDTGPYRGEMRAALVDKAALDYGLDQVAGELGWEWAFTRFQTARDALIKAMANAEADPELMALVSRLKAQHVPVQDYIDA